MSPSETQFLYQQNDIMVLMTPGDISTLTSSDTTLESQDPSPGKGDPEWEDMEDLSWVVWVHWGASLSLQLSLSLGLWIVVGQQSSEWFDKQCNLSPQALPLGRE